MLDEVDTALIRRTSLKLGLPDAFLEKDWHITRVIHTIVSIENEYFYPVFQGGTSLSKGYGVISRLSEDIDFRIVGKESVKALGKEKRRKLLREYRHEIINALGMAGYEIRPDEVNVMYEGRYTSIAAKYSHSSKRSYLKPYVSIELFRGDLLDSAVKRTITTLSHQGREALSDANSFKLACASLNQTAAEKWVALMRRLANVSHPASQSEKYLVRHIYDLYCLNQAGYITEKFYSIVPIVIKNDRKQFKGLNDSYYDDPYGTSFSSLSILKKVEWVQNWEDFQSSMVYGEEKIDYTNAYTLLEMLSKAIK